MLAFPRSRLSLSFCPPTQLPLRQRPLRLPSLSRLGTLYCQRRRPPYMPFAAAQPTTAQSAAAQPAAQSTPSSQPARLVRSLYLLQRPGELRQRDQQPGDLLSAGRPVLRHQRIGVDHQNRVELRGCGECDQLLQLLGILWHSLQRSVRPNQYVCALIWSIALR